MTFETTAKALFGRVRRDFGRLDILINDACLIRDELLTPQNLRHPGRRWPEAPSYRDTHQVAPPVRYPNFIR